MRVIRQQELIPQEKKSSSGEDIRRYYLPNETPFEVIETALGPRSTQPPHAHNRVREATLVIQGSVVVGEIRQDRKEETQLSPGDFAVFDRGSCHFIENRTDDLVRFLHFKFLGEGKDDELFRSDKLEHCDGPVTGHAETSVSDEGLIKSYVDTYNNIDKILWQMPALLLAVTALAFGLLKDIFVNAQATIAPLSRQQTLGWFCIAVAFMYVIGVYSIWRLRRHHNMMGEEIKKLEPRDGYFHKREKIAKKFWFPPSDTLTIGSFFTVAALWLLYLAGRNFGYW